MEISKKDILSAQTAIKYVQGVPLNGENEKEEGSIFGEAASAALWGSALPVASGIWSTGKTWYKDGFQAVKDGAKYNWDLSKEIGNKGITKMHFANVNEEGIRLAKEANKAQINIDKTIARVDKGLGKLDPNTTTDFARKEAILNKRRADLLIEKTKLTEAEGRIKDALKNNKTVDGIKGVLDAESAANTSLTPKNEPGFFGRIFNSVKKGAKGLFEKVPGNETISKGFDTASQPFKWLSGKFSNSTVGKFLKPVGKFFSKSKAGLALAFEGITQIFTEVIPAFRKYGFWDGMKQLTKSFAQTAAAVSGWMVGAKIGAVIGTAICPVVGTFIGGAVGFICGIAGQVFASSLAKDALGETTSERIDREEKEAQAKEIYKDPQALAQLKALVMQKIAEEQATGKISPETRQMLAMLQNTQNANGETPDANNTNNTNNANNANNKNVSFTGLTNPNDPYRYAVPANAYQQSRYAVSPNFYQKQQLQYAF